uniref:F-box domain-containing protein n=1 Tax=Moniliophthora roreri TaxID=221103 RepID=A0A0W0F0R6_MONRR
MALATLPHPRKLLFELTSSEVSPPQPQYSTSVLPSLLLFRASSPCSALQPSSHVHDTISRAPLPSYTPPLPHHEHDMPESMLPRTLFNTDADATTFLDSGVHTRLAPELWSEIFSHCVLIPDWPHGCIQYEKRLLVLMEVCSHWRQILLSTATLWRWIAYNSSASSLEKEGERIQTWLSRSREASLHVSLMLKHRNTARVLDDIISQSYRWESLHFSCRGFSPIPLLIPATRTFRALQHVELDSHLCESDVIDDLFEGSDRLTSLHLHKGHNSAFVALEALGRMSLSLTQLTCVHLEPRIGSAHELFAILNTLPNVVDLAAHIDAGSPWYGVRPLDMMRHDKLCSLSLEVELRGSDGVISHLQRMVAEILDHLTLPRLARFSFACPASHWPKPDKAFRSFLARMSGSLTHLRIVEKKEVDKTRRRRVSASDSGEYLDYLRIAPGIQKLEVELPEYRMSDPSLLLKGAGSLQSIVTISQGRS